MDCKNNLIIFKGAALKNKNAVRFFENYLPKLNSGLELVFGPHSLHVSSMKVFLM